VGDLDKLSLVAVKVVCLVKQHEIPMTLFSELGENVIHSVQYVLDGICDATELKGSCLPFTSEGSDKLR